LKTGMDMAQCLMAGQVFTSRRNWDMQVCHTVNDSVCCAYALTREGGHMKWTKFAQEVDTAG
jgi:hypothetical protein